MGEKDMRRSEDPHQCSRLLVEWHQTAMAYERLVLRYMSKDFPSPGLTPDERTEALAQAEASLLTEYGKLVEAATALNTAIKELADDRKAEDTRQQ